MATLGDFSTTTLDGDPMPLAQFDGDVVLVVNTASNCGFTPQYEGLEKLWQTYGDRGLTVIGFPCNQFGEQEPGTEDEIGEFCQKNYGVSFPMSAKVEVNGPEAHPVYTWLTSERGGVLGSRIKWNFTKFLIGRDGQVLGRYAPTTSPEALATDIESALES